MRYAYSNFAFNLDNPLSRHSGLRRNDEILTNGQCWFNRHALCRISMVLALLVPLAGHAGKLPQAANVSPEMRADFLVAMKSIQSEKYDQAIKSLNKMIAQAPSNPVLYINLALAYKKIENLTLAEENLKLAIKADPQNPVANNEYALLYRKTGRFSEARQTYEQVLKSYPNFNIAHKNLGILCDLYLKDYECALKQYQIYSAAMPDDAAVKIWIADIQGR